MENCLVSIVLLNWNGKKHIFDCIEHIQKQTYSNYEVIFVDNDSQDGSYEESRERYPQFRYVKNNSNLGYAKGMNIGIEHSSGEFVIPLNQDVCIDCDFISNAVKEAEKDNSIVAIGARIFNWYNGELSNNLRAGEGAILGFKKHIKFVADGSADFNKYVFGPAGSCPFLRKSALQFIKDNLGYYYDPMFETGWEDVDLFFKLNLFGGRVLYSPSVKAWHVGSGAVDGNDKFITKSLSYQHRIIRNRWFLIIKNIPLNTIIKILPQLLLFELALPLALLFRKPSSFCAYIWGMKEVILSAGTMLQQRKKIKNLIKLNTAQIREFIL